MNHPKSKTLNFQKLYQKSDKIRSDKALVEELITSLNELIQKNEKLQKKSASIIENWINKKN